jgi:hypothetical protein
MTAEEYARKALRDLANCEPFKSAEVLTAAFQAAIDEARQTRLGTDAHYQEWE